MSTSARIIWSGSVLDARLVLSTASESDTHNLFFVMESFDVAINGCCDLENNTDNCIATAINLITEQYMHAVIYDYEQFRKHHTVS